jgi:hypothetical protein
VNGSNCTMNKISKMIEKKKEQIDSFKNINDFDYNILMSGLYDITTDSQHYKEMCLLIKNFADDKKLLRNKAILDSHDFDNVNQIYKKYRNALYEVSTDLRYLTDLAVRICYTLNKEKDFVWEICTNGILQNLYRSPVKVPKKDKQGDIEYLGEKYLLEEVEIDEITE